MRRPRWHDVVLASAIVALLGAGVWALWWDDVRAALHLDGKGGGSGSAAAPSGGSATPPALPNDLPRT